MLANSALPNFLGCSLCEQGCITCLFQLLKSERSAGMHHELRARGRGWQQGGLGFCLCKAAVGSCACTRLWESSASGTLKPRKSIKRAPLMRSVNCTQQRGAMSTGFSAPAPVASHRRSLRFAGLPPPPLLATDWPRWGDLAGLPRLGLSDSCCRLICSPCRSHASCCTSRSVVSGLRQGERVSERFEVHGGIRLVSLGWRASAASLGATWPLNRWQMQFTCCCRACMLAVVAERWRG